MEDFLLSFTCTGNKDTSCSFDSWSGMCGWQIIIDNDNCNWKWQDINQNKGYMYLNGAPHCSSSIKWTFGRFDGSGDNFLTIEYYVKGPGPFSLQVFQGYNRPNILVWSCSVQPGNIKRKAYVYVPKSAWYISIMGQVAKGSSLFISQIWNDLQGHKPQNHCPLMPTTPRLTISTQTYNNNTEIYSNSSLRPTTTPRPTTKMLRPTTAIPRLTTTLRPTTTMPRPTTTLGPTTTMPRPTIKMLKSTTMPRPTKILRPTTTTPKPTTTTTPRPTTSTLRSTTTTPRQTATTTLRPTTKMLRPTATMPRPTTTLRPTTATPKPTTATTPRPTTSMLRPTTMPRPKIKTLKPPPTTTTTTARIARYTTTLRTTTTTTRRLTTTTTTPTMENTHAIMKKEQMKNMITLSLVGVVGVLGFTLLISIVIIVKKRRRPIISSVCDQPYKVQINCCSI